MSPYALEKAAEAAMVRADMAARKHPVWPTDPIHAAAIIAEEVGELQREALLLAYEPANGNPDRLREEALDLAAVALRFLVSVNNYQFTPSHQHQQP
jgi:hypothetical protein